MVQLKGEVQPHEFPALGDLGEIRYCKLLLS
jgi:hypothetical protein